MRLENNEYEITHKGKSYESITISKTALEKWRDHYTNVKNEKISPEIRMFYFGKLEVIIELLKHFEELAD